MLEHIDAMKHSPIRNYIVPGLTSWAIGEPAKDGSRVRLFEMEREQYEFITPHSHRFDFQCLVLHGSVVNTHWEESPDGDVYAVSSISLNGGPGQYQEAAMLISKVERFCTTELWHTEGAWYGMKAHEIHSIRFSKGARVLFFEGPTQSDVSTILEPYVDGEKVPTFKTQPWMFKRDLLVPAKPNRPMKGPDVCSRSPQ